MTVWVSALLFSASVQAAPPYGGTIFLEPNIITAADPTAFVSVTYVGQGSRSMYDRRVPGWITAQAYLFNAVYDDGLTIEIQVNPEFGSEAAARVEAEKYAPIFGRLPTALRTDVKTSWIHQGNEPFGGGNQNLLIHTGKTAEYESQGILEETLVHEASHSSLDAGHAAAQGWLNAQRADGDYISTYARDYPSSEDIAESFLTYLALRHRSDRVSESYRSTVSATIPNRIAYFDQEALNLYPISARPAAFAGTTLSLSAVTVGADRYAAELELVAGSNPLVFTLLSAAPAAGYAPTAAAFTDGLLTIPEVGVGGGGYSAELEMSGSSPMTFTLKNASKKY